MTIPSPLQDTLEQFEIDYSVPNEGALREGASTGNFKTQLLCEFLPWGESGCFVLATTGIVELEYAALQKTAVIFDAANRGTIELTGDDRLDCINRLATQQLLNMKEGESKLTFITSRKGGVLADVIIHVLRDKILIDLDCTTVEQVIEHLKSYIVMEDVQVLNKTDGIHWLWILGSDSEGHLPKDCHSYQLPIEFLGIKGIAIESSPDRIVELWKEVVQQGVRPIGWYALNMARVELGVPMFMIDFDSNNLPHETSLIQSRVRFDKGCYLGQEIVARMESLGQPKQRLVQLKMKTEELPISGAQLWADDTGSGTPVGVVTSSAISPLRGGVPAVIAMVGKKSAVKGSPIYTFVGQELVVAEIAELQSSPKDEAT